MSEWKEYRLEEVAQIVDCEHKTAPSVDASDFISVRTTDISNGRIHFDSANRVSEAVYLEWTKRLTPREGDIILAREAPVGEVGYVPDGRKVCLGQRTVLVRAYSVYVDNVYLLYYLTNPDIKQDLISRSTGSVVEHLNVKDIKNLLLRITHSLPEQRAIAGVLSSLDDKIDLLHRQNKTLEGIASTLWRKMFIEDADPGWKKGTLGDIADNIRVNVCVAELNNYEHYVGLEHIQKKHFALYDWGNTSELESNKSCFGNRDILFGKLRAYFHKVCFAPVDGVCSTDILVIRPKMPEFRTLCLLWFFSEDVVNYSDASSGGTRMPRTNWDTLASYEILIPPSESVARFNHHVLPMIDRIEHNIFSIRTLSRLRDTLLPKLMSGEARVRL